MSADVYPERHGLGARLRSWLGWSDRNPAEGDSPEPAPSPPARDGIAAARWRQIEEIGAFLGTHRLAVNAQTLALAHAYIAGEMPQLVRLIDRRLMAGKPLTSEWLEAIGPRAQPADELATLSTLMARLESSIDEFARTSRDAHRATSEYHSALVEHVDELEQVNLAGEVISELASIAQVMLKRTRSIERQMLRSEAQTRLLKRRLEEARRNADEDMLTGLPNRRAFEMRFLQEYRDARSAAGQLCVAFCDIDHFKLINDTHGHDAGDRVLRQVAAALGQISDQRCHVARHGGEEFVVLFRDLALSEAHERLDQARAQLAARHFINQANNLPFGQVTFSAGIADVFAFADRRAALKAADAALFRAKQTGRNRIEAALPPKLDNAA